MSQVTHNILILDTSSEACSIALFSQGQIFTFHELGQLKHNQLLIPGIQDLLDQAKIKPSELHEIYFGHGPGSFTGTRISAALSLGLAMGANIQAGSLSSLELLAQGIHKNFNLNSILILQDAQKNQAYLAGYEFINHQIHTLISPCLIHPEQLLDRLNNLQDLPWSGTGNAWFLLQEKLKSSLPKIKNLSFNAQAENWQIRAENGFDLIQQNKIYPPEIIYLREASDWLSTKT